MIYLSAGVLVLFFISELQILCVTFVFTACCMGSVVFSWTGAIIRGSRQNCFYHEQYFNYQPGSEGQGMFRCLKGGLSPLVCAIYGDEEVNLMLWFLTWGLYSLYRLP